MRPYAGKLDTIHIKMVLLPKAVLVPLQAEIGKHLCSLKLVTPFQIAIVIVTQKKIVTNQGGKL
jgi:hypothetical protein